LLGIDALEHVTEYIDDLAGAVVGQSHAGIVVRRCSEDERAPLAYASSQLPENRSSLATAA
jgi:hypothetical protein